MTGPDPTATPRAGGADTVLFGRVLTRTPVPFAAVSMQGLVIDANEAFAEMTGTPREEVNGRPLLSYVADFDTKRVGAALDALLTGRLDELHTELQFRRADGTLGTAIANATAIVDDDAQCVIVLLQDVTSHRRAERASTALRERLELLGRAGDLVNVELAVRPRMESFAHMVVPTFGDLCAVYLRAPDGNLWLRRFAAAAGPVTRSLRPLLEVPVARASDSAPAIAVRTGAIVHLDQSDLATQREADDTLCRALAGTGVTSLLCAPLTGAHETFGAVVFGVDATSGRSFDTDDENFARDLVARVSGALANAIQFEDEHVIAERLQRALLPELVPEVPGAEIAVRYRPSSGRGIGGDWYDVIRLPDGRVAFAVGDVIGHGIDAAVAMSMIRHALLAYAIDESDPVQLVTKLNRYLCRQSGNSTATLALVVCDLHSGALTITTAGHLPVIVRGAEQDVEFHGARLGRPLGLSPSAVFHAEPARLPEGGVLVLYTDGLIERRTESLNDGLDRLATGVAGTPLDDDLERFADTIATEVATDGSSDDDIALLLVRRTVAHDHFQTVIEARAERLASIRTDLRRWLEYIGCSEPVAADLVLAIGECAANVVEHAYPPGVTGPLEINADVSPDTSPDGGGLAEIIVEIRDHGRWRAPRDVGGGRGHDMLRQLVDEAHFDSGDDGTAVALTRRVELAAPASV